MKDFFNYVQKMWQVFLNNLWTFLKDTFGTPWSKVPDEFRDYHDIFRLYKDGFGAGGWILFVIYYILIAAIIFGILFLFFLLFRKLFRVSKKAQEQQELVEQVERLNYELYKAIDEKNKILNLKVNALGGKLPEEEDEENEETSTINSECRFTKLALVDEKYKNYNAHIEMDEADMLNLEQICDRFRLFSASQLGLYYNIHIVRVFFAGMGVGKLLILEGISGTGKTSLPYAMGKFFQNGAKICSVQPSWRDRSELIGYYNEFTKKFNETEFLKVVYECTFREDCNICILDEMNLARIEYYFAEFLSIMEMPNANEWNVELIQSPDPKTDPVHITDGKMLIPQNIWFIGTANNDDSTFTISDKVYDRAIVIFLNNKAVAFDAERTDPVNVSYAYMDKLYQEALTNYPISNKMIEKFAKLDEFVIANFKLAFGNRIMKQLKRFVPMYVACGGTELEAFDYIFSTKILKKFESLNIGFLKDELRELCDQLDKLFGKGTFPESKKYIEGFMKMGE